MQAHPQKHAIAIAKSKFRRQQVSQEPPLATSLAFDITMACLSSMFIAGLLFSTGALLCLAVVSIRCIIALW